MAYLCQCLSGPRTEKLATGVFCDRRAAEFQVATTGGCPRVIGHPPVVSGVFCSGG